MSKLTAITENGLTVSVDKEKLLADINELQWCAEENTANPEHCGEDTAKEFSTTEEDFNSAKEEMIKFVEGLDEAKLISCADCIRVTKKGVSYARGNFIAYGTNIMSGYSDWYGSHSYDTVDILFDGHGTKSASMYLGSTANQDSF